MSALTLKSSRLLVCIFLYLHIEWHLRQGPSTINIWSLNLFRILKRILQILQLWITAEFRDLTVATFYEVLWRHTAAWVGTLATLKWQKVITRVYMEKCFSVFTCYLLHYGYRMAAISEIVSLTFQGHRGHPRSPYSKRMKKSLTARRLVLLWSKSAW